MKTNDPIEAAVAAWAPDACTLPTAEQPLRVAEFDAFFDEAVTGVTRPSRGRVRMSLTATPDIAGRAATLMTKETACCSFFTFGLTATGGELALEVTVPDRHRDVLEALASRAEAATSAPS
jgi:hypothetical protein